MRAEPWIGLQVPYGQPLDGRFADLAMFLHGLLTSYVLLQPSMTFWTEHSHRLMSPVLVSQACASDMPS